MRAISVSTKRHILSYYHTIALPSYPKSNPNSLQPKPKPKTTPGFIVRDDLPDFKKADKGFDARGTDISGAQRTFKNMMDADICGGDLTYNPSGVAVNPDTWQPCNEEDDDRRLMEVEGEEGVSEAEVDYNEMQVRMLSGSTVNDTTCSYSRPYMLTNQWAPLVYAFEADGDDLFDTATVKAICQFSKVKFIVVVTSSCFAFNSNPRTPQDMSQQFYGFMAELNWATGESCHDRDLGFNIAYYYNKECAEITDEDVSNFKALLLSCAPAYESDKLRLCDFNVANCKVRPARSEATS